MKVNSSSKLTQHHLHSLLGVAVLLLASLAFDGLLPTGSVHAMLPPRGSAYSWADLTDSGEDSVPSNDYALNPVYVVGTACSEADYVYYDYDYYIRTTVSSPDGSLTTQESLRDPDCTRIDVYLQSARLNGTYNVDSFHYGVNYSTGLEEEIACIHESVIARTVTVYYGYQYSSPNPFSGGTICVYRKCDVAECGGDTLQEWVGRGETCPTGVKHDFWIFIRCWEGGHYHFPTFNPCP